MKIEQGNQYFTQYNTLGTKPSITKNASTLYTSQILKEDNNSQLPSDHPFTRINAYLAPPVKRLTDEELVKRDEDMMQELGDLADKLREELNDNLYKKFGIDGKIVAGSSEFVPQKFLLYYVETTSAAEPNKVIIQLENGEYIVGDTNQNHESVLMNLNSFRIKNDFSSAKFDVEKLKELLYEFLMDI